MLTHQTRNSLGIYQRQIRRAFHLNIHPEIQQALLEKNPIIALESTIISHGMPFPKNIEVAKSVERTVRERGAIPATIAVIHGVPHIGLTDSQLQIIANEDGKVLKASTRDLAYVCSLQLHAATTVASTMKLASLAGISVFATGGIGGVHRGGESSMDISADLIELGKTPVTVVCAGIKSILDIKRSLEVLETQGVPVLGYQTTDFPAFFTLSSGCKVPLKIDKVEDIARMILLNQQLNLKSGMVIAVPNPNPLKQEFVENVIAQALLEAENLKIEGAKVTPFLLSRIEKLSEGKSLESNIALVLNNAKVAAQIAKSYASLLSANSSETSSQTRLLQQTVEIVTSSQAKSAPSASTPSNDVRNHNDVMIIGGAAVDIIGNVTAEMTIPNTSNPGIVRSSFGGVGRNIAEQLSKLGIHAAIATAVGNDDSGKGIIESCKNLNIDTDSMIKSSENFTARYNAIHDKNGELIIGIADMSIFQLMNEQYVHKLKGKIKNSKIVICDGNVSKECFSAVAKLSEELQKPLFFEPTSDHKCCLPFQTLEHTKVRKIRIMFSSNFIC